MWTITVDLSRLQLLRLCQALLLAGEVALPFLLTHIMRLHR
jgi:hypothetical protein